MDDGIDEHHSNTEAQPSQLDMPGKRPKRNIKKKAISNPGKMVLSYKQKYISRWEKIPEYQAWLTQNRVTGSAHCLYCNVDINIQKGKTQLSRHCERLKHRKNERLWHKSPNVTQVVRSSSRFLPQQVQHAEAQVVAFLVENHLPLSSVEPLVGMLKKLPSVGDPVRKMQLPPEKAFSLISDGFVSHFKHSVVEKLKKVMFSIVLDETIDKDDNKYIVVCVSYCDDNLQTQADVLEIVSNGDNLVESLFNKLGTTLNELEEAGVPLKNWVGFLIDTSNALFLTTHQLAMLINEFYPWVIPIRSPCHMAYLAASSACEKLPMKLKNFCKLVHSHFRSNPNQSGPLLEFQEFCRLNVEKVLAPSQDQWLSVPKFIKHVIELWVPLEMYFTKLMAEDPNAGNDYKSVVEMLKDPITKVLFEFIEHVLSIISIYNKTFQTEEPLFFQLHKETTELVHKFALSFIRKDIVKTITNMMEFNISGADLLPLSQLYIGLDASITLKVFMSNSDLTYESKEVVALLEVCQNFYRELVFQIQSRFDLTHPVFRLARIINPQNAMSTEPATLSEFFASYDHPDWEKKKMEAEWRAVSNLNLTQDDDVLESPLRFWRYVLSRRSSNSNYKFSNLRQVIFFFLSLPFSSVVGIKVSKFLKRINISGRISLLNTDMSVTTKLPSYYIWNGTNDHSQKRRRKSTKKDEVQEKM